MCDIFHIYRNILARFDNSIFDITNVFDKPKPPYDVLGIVDLDHSRTHIDVRHLDRVKNFAKFHAVRDHRIRIDIDLVFLYKPAHRGNFANPFRTRKCITNYPVLSRTYFIEIPPTRRIAIAITSFDSVPENLTKRSCIWTKCRPNTRRDRS